MITKTPAQLLREYLDSIMNPPQTQKLNESSPVVESEEDSSVTPFGDMTPLEEHELEGIKARNPALYRKMRNWE